MVTTFLTRHCWAFNVSVLPGGRDYAAYFNTIQEYDPELDAISPVSYTLEVRAFSAISVVRAEDFSHWCS